MPSFLALTKHVIRLDGASVRVDGSCRSSPSALMRARVHIVLSHASLCSSRSTLTTAFFS
eukprot:6177303-Pleurochrysis_carterae.AAC.1